MDILAIVEEEAQRLRNRNGIGSGCANTETGLYDDELREHEEMVKREWPENA